MDVRTTIRGELKRRDWTQRKLCSRTHMLPNQLCRYLSGDTDISAETLLRILKVLELDIKPTARRRKGR